jgi:ABC-type lipoprotein release transport system permease subunit
MRLWVIAYRDLGRNRRRSILTLMAVALGLGLLIVLNGFIAGVMSDAMENSIRLQTGHVQVRADSYQEQKVSLQWKDLLKDPNELATQAQALAGVSAAAPVLWVNGILSTRDESVGLRIYGIEPAAQFHAPIQQGTLAGAYLTPDDRSGILLGKRLADNLGLGVDQNVSLTVIDANGEPEEAVFTIRGLFSTGVAAYDESAVFMPLAKAQALTRTEGRASAIVMLLNEEEAAAQTAASLQAPGLSAFTWQELNRLALDAVESAMSFYVILDAIVMLIVAVIIANTLLMSVFERIREMGILAALGMKGRQIMGMFLMEACILGLLGVIVGVGIGSLGIVYLAQVGIATGDMGAASPGIAIGDVMRARFVPETMAKLSFWTLAIIVLASLYPAWYAARLEPVEALRAT